MALVVKRKKAKDKIVKSLRNLSAIVDGLRSQGKSIVLATGCFDMLHIGHMRCLEDAKSRGDFLVVGIHDDKASGKIKGKGYPVHESADRMEMLANLESVDYVCTIEDEDGAKLLEMLKPAIFAKGAGVTERSLAERATLKGLGVRFLSCGGTKKAFSTSKIVQSVRKRKFE